MKRLAIYGAGCGDAGEAIRTLFSIVRPYYDRIYVYRPFGVRLLRKGILPGGERTATSGAHATGEIELADEFPGDVSIVVSIGGDGTFLRAAQWVGSRETPIIGLNAGHLGFLSSYSLGEVGELADMLCYGEGKSERRMVLEASYGPGLTERAHVLNEVAIVKGVSASMLTVRAYVDGHFLADYMADGLVIATPTGSTAYNLAVGGPILGPTLENMVLSPIAPHSLTMRPLVIGGESELAFEVYSRAGGCHLAFDGRTVPMRCANPVVLEALERERAASPGAHATGEGTEPLIRIRKASFGVEVLRRPESTFSAILREKLLWGRHS